MNSTHTTARLTALLLSSSTLLFAQWDQKAPATAPTARVGAALTWAPNTGGLLLFGGGAPLINGETWTYLAGNWTQLAPATSPSPRFGAQLTYDWSRNVAVLYGGLASNISIPPPSSDTWEFDGTTWTLASPAANPGPRYRHAIAYDIARSRTVLFGGVSSQLPMAPINQTWEYDGTNWTQIATTGSPGGRERPAMCFDPNIGRTVMFGGHDGTNLTDTTWLYDGATATWTQAVIPGAVPPPRNAATLVFDFARGVCVLTGGQNGSGVLSDTWIFDGTRWWEQPYATQGVRDHASAYEPVTKQVVKFGGFVAAPNTTTNSTWEFGNGVFGFGCAGTNGTPSLVSASVPKIGQNWAMNVSNLDPTFNFAIMVFGFSPIPGGIDLGPIVDMPGCRLYQTADLLLSAPIGAGGSTSWTWNPVSGLVGDSWYCQAMCLDPTVNGFGWTTSNAIYTTLGI
jgi:hypothetical protein